MWKTYLKLKKEGVLSINQRNADYILRYNDRNRFPLVDDKLQTKQLAIKSGIAVPELYQVINSEASLKKLESLLSPYTDFVIKPSRGAGGDGILVMTDQVLGHYRQINGKLWTINELDYHLSCLLSGAYSLGGHPDKAIIERRVVIDPVFAAISYEGVPDIRIIVLLGYPAMAMLRLPTRLSQGKANLHQGAIGVGLNISTGLTFGGVFNRNPIDYHPDTLNSVLGVQIPYWSKILEIAANCYDLTGLGYLGVDIVIDKDKGPLMLELNARPGLSIQVANREGTLARYQTIEKRAASVQETSQERVLFSQEHFK